MVAFVLLCSGCTPEPTFAMNSLTGLVLKSFGSFSTFHGPISLSPSVAAAAELANLNASL